VLLRLAYLGVTNAFALLRLLPMSDHDRDVEILALRHQTQAARNLTMDLDTANYRVKYLIATGTASSQRCSTPSSPTRASVSCSPVSRCHA